MSGQSIPIAKVGFEADLRDVILTNLPLRPAAAAQRLELEAKTTKDLLIIYCNWLNRLVHPHPRLVTCSQEFAKSLECSPTAPAIEKLLEKIAAGELLTPHLSRGVKSGWEPGGKASVSDFDLLLNDWSIHHLHTGLNLMSDGFVDRTNDVLVVIFRAESAYVLDIVKHGEWATSRLVEIAVRNWPSEKLFLPLPGILPGEPWSDAERKSLRKAGLPGGVTVDGTAFVSRTAMSTARTTMIAARQAARAIQILAYWEGHLEALSPAFQKAAILSCVEFPAVPTFRVVAARNFYNFGLGIQEVASGLVVGAVWFE